MRVYESGDRPVAGDECPLCAQHGHDHRLSEGPLHRTMSAESLLHIGREIAAGYRAMETVGPAVTVFGDQVLVANRTAPRFDSTLVVSGARTGEARLEHIVSCDSREPRRELALGARQHFGHRRLQIGYSHAKSRPEYISRSRNIHALRRFPARPPRRGRARRGPLGERRRARASPALRDQARARPVRRRVVGARARPERRLRVRPRGRGLEAERCCGRKDLVLKKCYPALHMAGRVARSGVQGCAGRRRISPPTGARVLPGA